MKLLSTIYFALFILITGCSKKDVAPVAQPVTAATYLNVAYGTDPLQNMDVYLPPNRSVDTTKVLIMIHGGAWSTGDKTDFNAYVDTMKKRLPGYAVFNINYRLAVAGVNLFPTQENDVKAAIEFIYARRSTYLVSGKFVLLGASAGAHLALLQAYKYASPVKIKAVVDFFGPTDMAEMYNNPASIYAPRASIAALMGGSPSANPGIYQSSSPINFVTPQSPPTIILQGGIDQLVSPAQSYSLNSSLQQKGVVHSLVLYPQENHGWTGINLSDSFNKIQVFLAANVL